MLKVCIYWYQPVVRVYGISATAVNIKVVDSSAKSVEMHDMVIGHYPAINHY